MDLPGARGYPYWPTADFAKFRGVYDAARGVEKGCFAAGKVPGWLQIGTSFILFLLLFSLISQLRRVDRERKLWSECVLTL